MHTRKAALAIFVVATVVACGSDDATTTTTTPQITTVTYKATLSGAAERPNAVTSAGTGTYVGTLDTKTNILTYTVTYAGLGSSSTLSHIHGPGTDAQAVGVLYNFQTSGAVLFTPGPVSQTYSGTILLTAATTITATVNGDSLRKLMDAGMTYVNVHSQQYGSGELRGQIAKQ